MSSPPTLYVFGAGKVGRALVRAARQAGVAATLRAARSGWPRSVWHADLVVIAVRDPDVAPAALALAAAGTLRPPRGRPAVVHCGGGLAVEALASLRERGIAIGRMHPLLSFAAPGRPPPLRRATMFLEGDAVAMRRAAALSRALGMLPRHRSGVDPSAYHAAAALVAGGAAALCEAGASILCAEGFSRSEATSMLGPLLGSVAVNVEVLGLPHALTGPVRRGDDAGVSAHLRVVDGAPGGVGALYRALAAVQLDMARALGEASADSFDLVSRRLKRGRSSR